MTPKKIFISIISALIALSLTALIITLIPQKTKAHTDPKVLIVSSTTYIPHENGQIICRFLDFEYSPINTTCWATVLYPNKNIFINQEITNATQLDNHYITFTVPETYGVYEYSVTCDVNGKNISGSKAFEVTTLANAIINFTNQTYISITDHITNQTLWINDSQHHQNELITNLTDRNFNISQNILNYVQSNMTNITLTLQNNLTELINTQIGTETNESVKSLLLQIKEKLGFITTNITINTTAPNYVHIGEEWNMKAYVYNQAGTLVGNTDVTCNTTSNYYTETAMTYQGSGTSWNYNFIPTSSGVIHYEVECEII